MATTTATKTKRAGKALKSVMQEYGFSQNQVAVKMGYARSTVNQWVNGVSDPLADSVPDIYYALEEIVEGAGDKFISNFLEVNYDKAGSTAD